MLGYVNINLYFSFIFQLIFNTSNEYNQFYQQKTTYMKIRGHTSTSACQNQKQKYIHLVFFIYLQHNIYLTQAIPSSENFFEVR